jgi:hypothetical protein
MNCNHFQLTMLVYNSSCWLMLFNREEEAKVEMLKHPTLATARLRFLSKTDGPPANDCGWRPGLRTGIGSCADRLMTIRA